MLKPYFRAVKEPKGKNRKAIRAASSGGETSERMPGWWPALF
jgi:hypothetical protein